MPGDGLKKRTKKKDYFRKFNLREYFSFSVRQ